MSDNRNDNKNNEIIRIDDVGGQSKPSISLDEYNASLEMQRSQILETTSILESQKEAINNLVKIIKQTTGSMKEMNDTVKVTKKQSDTFVSKDKLSYEKRNSEDRLNRIKQKRDQDFFQRDVEKIQKDRAKIAFGDFIKRAGQLPDQAVKAMLPYAKSPIKMFDLIPVAFSKVFGAVGDMINGKGRGGSSSQYGSSSIGRMLTPSSSASGMVNPFADVGKIFEQMESGIDDLNDTYVDTTGQSNYDLFLLGEFLQSPTTTPLGQFFQNLFAGMGVGGGGTTTAKPKSDLVMLAIIAGITAAIFALAPGLNFLIKTLAPVIASALALIVTIWTDLWAAFKPVLPIITELLKSVFGAILDIWGRIKGQLIDVVVKVLNLTFNLISMVVDGIYWLIDFIPKLPDMIGKFFTKIKDWLFALPGKIGQSIGDFFSGVGNFFGGAGKAVGDFVGGTVDNVKATAGKVWDGAVKFGKDIWAGFENLGIFKGIKTVLDVISGGITALFGAFDDVGFFLRKVGFRMSKGLSGFTMSEDEVRKG
jgi:hypothetical protein